MPDIDAALAFRDYGELHRMLSGAKVHIRAGIWRFVEAVMQSPNNECDRAVTRRQLELLRACTREALRRLTKQTSLAWVEAVNTRLLAAVSRLFLEFVHTLAVPLSFEPWDPVVAGQARPAQSLALYRRYVRAYISLSETDVVGAADSAAGLELRTACFAEYAGDFAPHAHVSAVLVAVAGMLHERLDARSAGLCLDDDCLRLVCAQLLAPKKGFRAECENQARLLAAPAATRRP